MLVTNDWLHKHNIIYSLLITGYTFPLEHERKSYMTELSGTNARRQKFMRPPLESSGLAAILYSTDAIYEGP